MIAGVGNMRNKIKNNRNAFTMIEMIGVIIILGLLFLIAVPAVSTLLARFRMNYYEELEETITLTGKTYMQNRKNSRPKEDLHSKVIKLDKLVEDKLINEVTDYNGNKCDNSGDNYSYFIVVKNGEKTYDYATCLKCSGDHYATDPEKQVFCNPDWMTNGNITTTPTVPQTTAYVHTNSSVEDINEILKTDTARVVKKDSKGKVIGDYTITTNNYIYPTNPEDFVSATPKTGTAVYKFENSEGDQVEAKRPVQVYEYGAVNIKGERNNQTSSYDMGEDSWGYNVRLTLTIPDNWLKTFGRKVKQWQYFDQDEERWMELTQCGANTTTCIVNYNSPIRYKTKFRYVDDQGAASKDSKWVNINVEQVKPTCTLTLKGTTGTNGWYKSDVTVSFSAKGDTGGSRLDKYGLSSQTTALYDNKDSKVQTDTTGVVWYGYVIDRAGNTNKCQTVSFKADKVAPESCTISMSSNNAAFSSGSTAYASVVATTNATDATSGVANKQILVKSPSTAAGSTLASPQTVSYVGTSTVTPVCTDKAGNVKTGSAYTIKMNNKTAVTLNQQSGTGGTGSVTATYGAAMPGITKPTRSCYTFGGYYTGTNGGGTQYYNAGGTSAKNWDMTIASTTLYAKWTLNTYTITYNANGGSGQPANQTKNCGANITLSSQKPTRKGYTFLRWSTNAAGTGTTYNPGATYTANAGVTLYAIWAANCSSTKLSCGNWGNWGTCSKKCGTGTQSRTRTCNNVSTYTGEVCSANTAAANTTQSQNCNTMTCCSKTYVSCGNYGAWSACSLKCGTGTQKRTRTCGNYSSYDNSYCSANTVASNTTQSQNCNTMSCCSATTKKCGDWGAYGGCSKSCGGGTKTRTRSCANYSNYDGRWCSAAASESNSASCNTQSCAPTIKCYLHGGTSGYFDTTNKVSSTWGYIQVVGYTTKTNSGTGTSKYETGYGTVYVDSTTRWRLSRSSYVPLNGKSKSRSGGYLSSLCAVRK